MSFFKKLFKKDKKEQVQEEEIKQEVLLGEEEPSLQNEERKNEEEDLEEVEELLQRQEVEELPKVEEIQEIQEIQEVEQLPEVKEIQEADKLVETDELPKIEELQEVKEVIKEQEVEQLPVIEEVQTVEEAQEVLQVEEAPEEVENATQEGKNKKQGFMKRLFSGLTKTRDSILKGVEDVLSTFKQIDEDLYEELEEALIMADFGVETTLHIMEKLKQTVKERKITEPTALKATLQEIISNMLMNQPSEPVIGEEGPTVVLVIGVNGVGKTTSIGKMAHLFKQNNKKVLIAAADTFRAAAIEQLQVWSERAGVEIIKHDEGTDAAAVIFDAIAAAKSRKTDILICDTAGRLQNKTNLMKELEKISRIIAREYPEAKKEVLIALDATTGQNAIQQVKLFKEVAAINGIILTKLDGTAKGGAIVGIYESLKVPVKFIGVGEKIDDLQPFDAEAFATALFQSK